MASDLAIASENARFMVSQIKIGATGRGSELFPTAKRRPGLAQQLFQGTMTFVHRFSKSCEMQLAPHNRVPQAGTQRQLTGTRKIGFGFSVVVSCRKLIG